jgi:hypothetical protein
MSTTGHPGGARAGQPAERVLFQRLFDDAAVFPPGLAPLPRAVSEHVERRKAPWADLVGPLLLPASAVEELLALERPERLEVAVIGRPGTDPAVVTQAVDRLGDDASIVLAGVEIGWSEGWQEALHRGVPLSLEVPAGVEPRRALAEIAASADERTQVQAKFRTGATATTPAPTPAGLATFLRACIDAELSFKLTGGLHHAFTHTTAEGEDQSGFLNVLCAVRWALNGAGVDELESLLTQRDPLPVMEMVTRMSGADASVVRAFFTSYGCCGVMDPIGDLSALGLIKETV